MGVDRQRAEAERESDAVTAMLAEYSALRQEILQAIANRVTVTSFTFAALSVVIAGLLAKPEPNLLFGIVGLLFVPQLAKAGLLIWLGEYHRSQRAGRWLAALEQRIDAHLGVPDALGWESSLSTRGSHMGYPYLATALLVLGAGYVGSLVGGFYVYQELDKFFHHRAPVVIAGILIAYVLVVEVMFFRFVIHKWREIRTA